MDRTFAQRIGISWRLARGRLRYLRKAVRNVRGERPRECPICGWRGRFINFGTPPQFDVVCPDCGSHPRQRLLKLVQESHAVIRPGGALLHFAPEKPLKPIIRSVQAASYVTADLRPGYDLVLDIENIDRPAASVDTIICSHVLEHVDDGRALAELFRILKPGGRLIAMIPILEGADRTYENAAVTSWRERKIHFGGGTHVRYYGRDFRDRVRNAGFSLTEYAADEYDPIRYGLIRGERVFVAGKPLSS